MGARGLAVLVLCAAALVTLPAAGAADGRVVPLSFAGASCDSVASASFRLPAAARLAFARNPVVGDWIGGTKADRYSRKAMARVTGVDIQGRLLTVTLAADPARCLGTALPGEPVDAAWAAAVDADVSYIVPDERWARLQTKSLIRDLLAPYYAAEARIRCRSTAQARFSCSFGTFAGDATVVGRGSVSIGRDDEVPHYAFRVKTLDEYCYYVVHKPLRTCLKTARWRA